MLIVNLNFNGYEFSIAKSENGFDINDLRLQVVDFNTKNPELQICRTGKSMDMAQWTRNLSDTAKAFYKIEKVRGGVLRGATYANERGVYAYASWLNEEFGFAVIEAFTLLVHGETEEAVKVVKKVVRTAIRQDNVDYTKHFASKVNEQFGVELLPAIMSKIQNHINRTLFGVETEELRELARQHTGSKAKKIAHREFYDDDTLIRITAMTTHCILKFKELYGKALSPRELSDAMFDVVTEYGKTLGEPFTPTFREIK